MVSIACEKPIHSTRLGKCSNAVTRDRVCWSLTCLFLAPKLCFTHQAACLQAACCFHDLLAPLTESFYPQVSLLCFNNSSLQMWRHSKTVVELCFGPRLLCPWKVSVTSLSSLFSSVTSLVVSHFALNERTTSHRICYTLGTRYMVVTFLFFLTLLIIVNNLIM